MTVSGVLITDSSNAGIKALAFTVLLAEPTCRADVTVYMHLQPHSQQRHPATSTTVQVSIPVDG